MSTETAACGWQGAAGKSPCAQPGHEVRGCRGDCGGGVSSPAFCRRQRKLISAEIAAGDFGQSDQGLSAATPALQTTSSCDPVAPEQPIAPMSRPPSTSGI